MTPIEDMTTVTPATPLTELAQIFDETHFHGLAVIDQHNRLLGVVTLNDLEQAQAQGRISGEVRDIYSRGVHTVFPDSTVEEALRHFGALDVGRIPVVGRKDPHRVIAMLRRGDIVRAYSLAYMDEQARLAHMDRGKLEHQTGGNALEIRLQEGHRAVGKEVQDLDLPPQTLLASVRRGGEILIPRGDTCLEVGDVVVALVPEAKEETLRSQLIGREDHHHPRTA
jgi:CBS domain-containing protein